MNQVLTRWNAASPVRAINEITSCCGAAKWAESLVRRRPFPDESSLLAAADEVWRGLNSTDWREAFHHHPRIGESSAKLPQAGRSASWSQQEQGSVSAAQDDLKVALSVANRAYEEKFGHIFIVCATGKSAAEILAILRRRMQNDGDTELREAAEEQRQIMQLRLKKWLGI